MSVGIVIPAYNVGPYIVQAVKSALLDRHYVVEVVVIDDGSTSPVAAIIENAGISDTRVAVIRQSNRGVCVARNTGLRTLKCKSDFVMFLDGDDQLQAETIATLVEELDQTPTASMIHCEPRFIDEAGMGFDKVWTDRWAWREGRVARLTDADTVTPFESIFALAGIIPSLTLFRREIVESEGGYDEGFGHFYEDTDLNLRVALRGEVLYSPKKLVDYRIRPGQATANQMTHGRQLEKLRCKWRRLAKLPENYKVRFAEWFVEYPLAAKLGWDAARDSLAKRNYLISVRFYQGAIRRYCCGKLLQP